MKRLRWLRPIQISVQVATVAIVGLIHARFIGHYKFIGTERFSWTVVYAIFIIALSIFLDPNSNQLRSANVVAYSFAVPFLAIVAISTCQIFLTTALLPRFLLIVTSAAVVIELISLDGVEKKVREKRRLREKVIFVVSKLEKELLLKDIDILDRTPYTVDRIIDAENEIDDITTAVEDARPSLIVLDRTAQENDQVVRSILHFHNLGTKVRTLSMFYEEWLGKVPLTELARMSLLFDIGEIHSTSYARLNRMFDLVLCLVGLPLFGLSIPFVLFLDIVGNPGPLFFVQSRVGKNGSHFKMIKFRSMLPSEEAGSWTKVEDSRLNWVGKFMRKSHLDELPQFLNVFKGSMSVVGPRPEQPQYVERLHSIYEFYNLRHLVKPGITGWAQVKYRYSASEEEALDKLQFEFYYLRRQSMMFNIVIVLMTLRNIVGFTGR